MKELVEWVTYPGNHCDLILRRHCPLGILPHNKDDRLDDDHHDVDESSQQVGMTINQKRELISQIFFSKEEIVNQWEKLYVTE